MTERRHLLKSDTRSSEVWAKRRTGLSGGSWPRLGMTDDEGANAALEGEALGRVDVVLRDA
eukprot:12727218-Alexandrium_andersonii.AAC.1